MNTNWIGGGDPELYHDPYQSGVQSTIYSLNNSNQGAQGAASAERAIGRRYEQRQEQIESDPNFGRNAAVSGKLHDMALSEVGGETSDAYVKGASVDQQAKERAAQLGLQEGQLQFGINQENYQREQSQTFGNSFVGGLLKDAIGFAAGGAEGIGADYINGMVNPKSAPETPSLGTQPGSVQQGYYRRQLPLTPGAYSPTGTGR